MANISFAGLGGGGVRVTLAVINWLQNQIRPEFLNLGKTHLEWNWLFGEYVKATDELLKGFGSVFLDARSDELAKLGEEYQGRRYLTSERGGYGGDWNAQLQDLERMNSHEERRISRIDSKETTPTVWLNSGGFGACHSFIPIFSMDGGSGRGCFEFLIAHKREFLNPSIEMIGPLAIAPQIAQLHDDMRRANVLSGVDSFKEKLRSGLVNYIMYVDNDMATFKAARWRGIMQEKDAEKMSREIGFHIEKRENSALANQIELYAKKYGNVKNPELNAAITTALVPFLQTSLGSLMESKIETVYPKDFDHRDFARFMQGTVTVPAYSYVGDMRALKDNYKSAGYDEDQVYELELDATIAHDTFAPMPYSVDGVREWTDGIYVFFWSKREIDMSDHARLVSYIGDTLGGDIQVIFMSGDDPMKGHIFDGHAEMRIWAYLRLRDTDLLKAKVSGINGGR